MNRAIIEIAVPGAIAYFFPKLIRKLKKTNPKALI